MKNIIITFLCLIAVAIAVNAADDWTQKFPPEPLPAARYAHAMAYIGEDQVLMFGGNPYNNETWLYDLGDNTWTNLDPSGDIPEERRDHDMAYIGGDQVLLFGGYRSPVGTVNDTWLYTLSTNTWTHIFPASLSPEERYSHALCYIGDDQVFLYGGAHEGYLGDSWIYDLSENTWTNVTPTGDNPTNKHYHDIVRIDEGQALLFGGFEGGAIYSDETWLYDHAMNTWTDMSPAEPIPHERFRHAMAYIGSDQVVMYGGEDQYGEYGDTWVYDISENSWTLDNNTVTPGTRWRHKMSETSLDGSSYIVMFGGHLYGFTDDETWTFGGGDFIVSVSPGHNLNNVLTEYQLAQNYPNPFNPTTTIRFELPKTSHVELTVYDLQGRKVIELVSGMREAGLHEVTFNGSGLASGIYFYRIHAGDFCQTRKMILVK